MTKVWGTCNFKPPYLSKLGFTCFVALFLLIQILFIILKILFGILSPNRFKQIEAKLLHCTGVGTDQDLNIQEGCDWFSPNQATNYGMYITLFWDVMLRSPAEHSQCFRGTCHLHLHGNKISQSSRTVIQILGQEGFCMGVQLGL
jgi:hypothetical protein